MIPFRNLCFLLATLLTSLAVSAHALPTDPEPATPTGLYDLTPLPPGNTGQVLIVPGPIPGLWFGYVFVNEELIRDETFAIVRAEGGGYLWENNKVGRRTGQTGGGTLKWNDDHYESEVTQGDNTGTRRDLTPH